MCKKNLLNKDYNALFEKVILLAIVGLPLLIISWNIDNDLWFLLSHGRYVETNGIPTIEPLTMHENFSFVMQQWLFSLGAWFLFDSFGANATIFVVYLLAIIICVQIFLLAYITSAKKFKLSSFVTFVSFLGLCILFTRTRPQIVTYIIVLSEILSLELYTKTNKFKWLFVLPFLSVLQINVHASMWGMLFVFALPFIVNSFKFKFFGFNSKGCKKIPLFISLLLMFLCGFINPYGLDAMTYVLSSYGQKLLDSTITEMAVISVRDIQGFMFFILLFAVVLIFKFNKEYKTELRYELLLYGTILLTLLSQKSFAYFLIGCVPFFSSICSNLEDEIIIFTSNQKRNQLLKILLPTFLILIICCSLFIRIENYKTDDNYSTSAKAIDFLAEQVSEETVTNVYVGFNDGGYAEYRGFKAYMDPRAEVFLKSNNNQKDIFEEYIKMQYGQLYYKDVLSQYDFDYLIADKSDILYIYLKKDKDYKIIYEDENSRIYKPINKER